jgi:hypothetical protein
MKRLVALILITLSATAMAQHHHHHHHRHGGWGYNGWIAPVIVSGVIGYEIARRQSPPVIVQQPVVVQPAPYYGQTQVQSCTAWNEIQTADGRIYRERTCTQ